MLALVLPPEPWAAGTSRVASTAFCLLFKLCTMRLTRNQLRSMLNHADSVYIRCLGFLLLRYATPPAELYMWYEPYLDDLEVFSPGADSSVTVYVAVLCGRLP